MIIATTVILGLTVALVAVRDAIGGELEDLAGALRSLDQSYAMSGFRGCRKWNGSYSSWTAGSFFFDPHLRTAGPVEEEFPGYVEVCQAVTSERCETVPSPTVREIAPVVPPTLPLSAPCTTCPPIQLEPQPLLLPEQEVGPECCIPCLSCTPGTNGLLAPTPIAALPSCSAPVTIQSAPLTPVCHPQTAIPFGPLQVW